MVSPRPVLLAADDPVLKRHWLFLPAAVLVSVAGGVWTLDWFMLPRILGLLPFFVLGLHLKPRHLRHLDDPWVKVAAVGALVLIAVLSRDLDDWARTAFLWYDAGYEDLDVQLATAAQTRLSVMAIGLLGAFSVMALIPRRGGWFTAMGAATMNVYLLHGFVIKTVKAQGFTEWSEDHPYTRAADHHGRLASRSRSRWPARGRGATCPGWSILSARGSSIASAVLDRTAQLRTPRRTHRRAGHRVQLPCLVPGRRRSPQVRRIPRRPLPRSWAVVRTALDFLEQLRQANAEVPRPLGEVGTGRDRHRFAEGEVDAASAGQVGPRPPAGRVGPPDAVDPLAAPERHGDHRRPRLARQAGHAPHQRPHGVGVGDPGLGEAAHRLALARAAAGP